MGSGLSLEDKTSHRFSCGLVISGDLPPLALVKLDGRCVTGAHRQHKAFHVSGEKIRPKPVHQLLPDAVSALIRANGNELNFCQIVAGGYGKSSKCFENGTKKRDRSTHGIVK